MAPLPSGELTRAFIFAEIVKINPNPLMSDHAISTESLSHESRTFPPSPEIIKRALINAEQFDELYQRSLREPEKFWLEQAHTLEWFSAPSTPGNSLGHRRAENPAHVVRRRGTEFHRQLPRPPSQNPRQSDRHHLAGRTGRGSEATSPTRNCIAKSASSPTRSNRSASKKATAWRFTCR